MLCAFRLLFLREKFYNYRIERSLICFASSCCRSELAFRFLKGFSKKPAEKGSNRTTMSSDSVQELTAAVEIQTDIMMEIAAVFLTVVVLYVSLTCVHTFSCVRSLIHAHHIHTTCPHRHSHKLTTIVFWSIFLDRKMYFFDPLIAKLACNWNMTNCYGFFADKC